MIKAIEVIFTTTYEEKLVRGIAIITRIKNLNMKGGSGFTNEKKNLTEGTYTIMAEKCFETKPKFRMTLYPARASNLYEFLKKKVLMLT